MKKLTVQMVFLMLIILLISSIAFAGSIPTSLSYQGTMVDKSGQPVTMTKNIVFSLYNVATDGTAFWSETQTVAITNGQFTAQLGTNQANQLNLATFGGDTWLGLTINGEPEMTPREKMTSVPYAFNGVPKGVITMWSGSIATIPQGWAICDGTNGTPNLKDRFIVGAGTSYAVGATGGVLSGTINLQHQHPMPHTHDLSNHRHYGFGNGGDMRAAIGFSNNNYQFMSHVSVSAINPVTQSLPATPNSTSIGQAQGIADNFNDFTPVYGYTSYPDVNASGLVSTANTSNAGSTSQDIRPPYYALAYIMKL